MNAKKAPDRRTARTQDTLYRALFALILRKGYDAVTVQDIIDEANVGRSTFYGHYTGKEELLRSGFERLRPHMVEEQRSARARNGALGEKVLGFSLAMFEHALSHRDLYRAMVGGRGGTVAIEQLRRLIGDLVREDLAAGGESEAIPREFVVQYLVGAFLSTMLWWLDRKSKLSPVEIDAMFRRVALKGIGSIGPA